MGSYTVSVLFYLVYFLSFNILVGKLWNLWFQVHVTFIFNYKILSAIYFVAESQEPCQTPENTNGQCLVLQECSSLNDLVKKRPLPQETIDYLRKAHCGFSGKQPKVCCATTTTRSPGKNALMLT